MRLRYYTSALALSVLLLTTPLVHAQEQTLRVTKTYLPNDLANPGEARALRITVRNSQRTPVTNLRVEDPLPLAITIAQGGI